MPITMLFRLPVKMSSGQNFLRSKRPQVKTSSGQNVLRLKLPQVKTSSGQNFLRSKLPQVEVSLQPSTIQYNLFLRIETAVECKSI